MNLQNQVVLSIGSNEGDRMKALSDCIAMLHREAGTIVRISRIYETPAWGFESADFYNCVVLMNTHKNIDKLWRIILSVEQTLGRNRVAGEGYQPRTIDVDIVDYNNTILDSAEVTVPHPRMHLRRFVLQPLKDILPQYEHPGTLTGIDKMIADCKDNTSCTFVAHIKSPLSALSPEQFNYIAIEGNIGAGKTTLATKIAEDFNAKLVLERFADNPFLPKFYKDQQRYAFPLEMSFLADRYQQLSDDLAQFDLFKDFIVADYHIFKSLIFANVTLTEDENRLYRKLFEIIYKEMPKPGLYIYLYQNTERLLENIKSRGRSYEQEIPAEYLDKINRGYLDYIKTQTELNVIIIDVSDKDFVENQEDYLSILEAIGSA